MNLIEEKELEGIVKATDFKRLSDEQSLSINEDYLNHPVYGKELKIYLVLTHKDDLFLSRYSVQDVFYSRYYYFLKFVETCKGVDGPDAGLDQQVFRLLEEGGNLPDIDWSIVEALHKRVIDKLS